MWVERVFLLILFCQISPTVSIAGKIIQRHDHFEMRDGDVDGTFKAVDEPVNIKICFKDLLPSYEGFLYFFCYKGKYPADNPICGSMCGFQVKIVTSGNTPMLRSMIADDGGRYVKHVDKCIVYQITSDKIMTDRSTYACEWAGGNMQFRSGSREGNQNNIISSVTVTNGRCWFVMGPGGIFAIIFTFLVIGAAVGGFLWWRLHMKGKLMEQRSFLVFILHKMRLKRIERKDLPQPAVDDKTKKEEKTEGKDSEKTAKKKNKDKTSKKKDADKDAEQSSK